MSGADRERWDAKYVERQRDNVGVGDAEPLLTQTDIVLHLPRSGRALDLAGGAGRNALWLAARGLKVCLVDVSSVALEMASREASRRGLSLVTQDVDLQLGVGPLLDAWDLVLCTHYLDRSLLAQVHTLLAPGGVFVMVHPTRRNAERHRRPSERFLLLEGELSGLLPDLEVLHYAEGWTSAGHHLARFVGRRLSTSALGSAVDVKE